jgi:hypothetical protein
LAQRLRLVPLSPVVLRNRVALSVQQAAGPPSPLAGTNELKGSTGSGELWAFVEQGLPVRAGHPWKIIWSISGSGPLRIAGSQQDGTQAQVTFGPVEHISSTWHRPGSQWGSAMLFSKAGCWRLHCATDTTAGDIWIMVEP